MNKRLRSRLSWWGLAAYAMVCMVFEQRPIRLGALVLLAAYMAGLSVYGLLRQRDTSRRILLMELVADVLLLAVLTAVLLFPGGN